MTFFSFSRSFALSTALTLFASFPVALSAGQNASSTNLAGQFWAGADIGTIMRMEAIPGRKFYDYDGVTAKDPIKTLGDTGVNVVRVLTSRGQCLGPTNFTNNKTTRADELLFKLDFGCIDIQVKTAQRAVAEGMQVVLTINQGLTIPKDLESLNYTEMLTNIQAEAKRQLEPFLSASILPLIILLENEGTSGFLFEEESTGHARGVADSKADASAVDKERCGQIPTGNIASYPQLAGYYKAEIFACNEAISAAGLDPQKVRFGLHSHGQYVQWKEGLVHGPDAPSQTNLTDSSDKPCPNENIIPQDLLDLDVADMLTIAGFSAYPDPMTPTDINSPEAQNATLDRLTKTLTQLQGYADKAGKFDTGPYVGQYRLQSLGVEYATSFLPEEFEQEQALTEMMWERVKGFSSCLGMMWWEPWYCYNDWEGGRATLCRKIGEREESGEVPTEVLRTWGMAARS